MPPRKRERENESGGEKETERGIEGERGNMEGGRGRYRHRQRKGREKERKGATIWWN